jgi:SOS response regulatory protein OraA/RecX
VTSTQKFYDRQLEKTRSPKKARRALRHAIAREMYKRGFSHELRSRATNGALRGYAKKFAIAYVSAFRRGQGGAE